VKLPALVLVALGASLYSAAGQGVPGSSLSSPGGRYVFGQISQMSRDQYMLDTQTGRLWQIRTTTNELPMLQSVAYYTLDYKWSLVPPAAVEEERAFAEYEAARHLRDMLRAHKWFLDNPKGGSVTNAGGVVLSWTEEESKEAAAKAKLAVEEAEAAYLKAAERNGKTITTRTNAPLDLSPLTPFLKPPAK
jgi:hypothetical protein